MIFSELYSAYYNAVAGILRCASQGDADEAQLRAIVTRYAFSDSVLSVLPSLKSGQWQLLHQDLTTPIQNTPTMPLTTLQKSWLNAISLDPRIRLFGDDFSFSYDVQPLFTPEDIYVYDRYDDGDPYFDEGYIRRFRIILRALREHKALRIESVNRYGKVVTFVVLPKKLEYSEKDDKFRLIATSHNRNSTINLARIVSCRLSSADISYFGRDVSVDTRMVTLRITDRRNALERTMLHFAHFEKQAERIDDDHYLLRINYDTSDETEIVIRILSFGPMVEVTAPEPFRNLIKERLIKQKSCGLI